MAVRSVSASSGISEPRTGRAWTSARDRSFSLSCRVYPGVLPTGLETPFRRRFQRLPIIGRKNAAFNADRVVNRHLVLPRFVETTCFRIRLLSYLSITAMPSCQRCFIATWPVRRLLSRPRCLPFTPPTRSRPPAMVVPRSRPTDTAWVAIGCRCISQPRGM